MTPKLCKAGQQLREQFDDTFPDRDRTSDGWIADARHVAAGKSDHIPSVDSKTVRAIDVDRDVSGKAKPDLMPDIADQIRLCAKASTHKVNSPAVHVTRYLATTHRDIDFWQSYP